MNKNKIYLLFFILTFSILMSTFVLETDIIKIFSCYFNNVNYNSIALNSSLIENIKWLLNSFEWKFDYIIIWTTNIFQLILPIFYIIGCIIYFNINKNSNIKKIMNFAFKTALSIFTSYIFFYLIIVIICKCEHTDYITRNLFLDIFGANFYYSHTFIYYILDGLVRFLIVPFIYFSSSILLTSKIKNKSIGYYYILISYMFLSLLSNGLCHLLGDAFKYLNPAAIIISGSYTEISTVFLLLINIGILFLSIFVFYKLTIKYNYKIKYIIFIIVNCATLFIYFKVNGNKYFSIIAVYQCIAFITNYLFFTNNLIFNNYKKDKLSNMIKRTLFYNAIIAILVFIINLLELLLFDINFVIKDMFVLTINLFFISAIISLFIMIFSFKKYKNYIDYSKMNSILIIFYILYIFTYCYGNNLFVLNPYMSYFNSNNLIHILINYLLWFGCIIGIIYIKYRVESKRNGYVRIKRNK